MNAKKHLSEKTIIRTLLLLVLILALLAGYFHAALSTEKRKYLKLEDQYVRVRSQLGREETQRLIDETREQEFVVDY